LNCESNWIEYQIELNQIIKSSNWIELSNWIKSLNHQIELNLNWIWIKSNWITNWFDLICSNFKSNLNDLWFVKLNLNLTQFNSIQFVQNPIYIITDTWSILLISHSWCISNENQLDRMGTVLTIYLGVWNLFIGILLISDHISKGLLLCI